jgi:hypothetical protein
VGRPRYDRLGRLVASDVAGLLDNRPLGDAAVRDDLPDETGTPLSVLGDAHDVMTGSDTDGRPLMACRRPARTGAAGSAPMAAPSATPGRRRSGAATDRRPPDAAAPPASTSSRTGPAPATACVGCGGGYGGIYCFALEP